MFKRGAFTGLFLTSMSALMLEILLTRVFSVATWYYFAFFAISVAMFGFTVGAIIVYLGKNYFRDDLLFDRLAVYTLLFGVTVDIALMVFLSMPFFPRLTGVGIFATAVVYLFIALPFVFAGIVICLCITRFPEDIGLVYAADLIGAGLGAFMVFPVLNAMDAPTAILFTGALAALGGITFAGSRFVQNKNLKTGAAVVFLTLTAFMLVNFTFRPVRVEWVKARYNVPEVESWNAFSRIAVYPLKYTNNPYSWGMSRAYKKDKLIPQRMIDIDGVSNTVMTGFNGDLAAVDHLKYDVTAIAHYLRKDAKVFIIGVGGGRDILAAKVFGQKEVVGAEINNRTLEMLNYVFGNFTGHLDKLPGVRIINDEARNAITRMDEKFDIIQASCIATWSATTAGAFSLAENSLYTVEGWKIFYDRLKPDGILSFNRWYSPDYPAQLLRLASLAAYTLKNEGVKDPGSHIAIVRSEVVGGRMPSATILIGKRPFSADDLKTLDSTVEKLRFKYVYNPAGYKKPLFVDVIKNAGDPEFYKTTALDLSPSTDDRPFFFYMLRLKDVFSGKDVQFQEQMFNLKGVKMLVVLMIVSIVLSVIFIFGPVLFSGGLRAIPPLAGSSGLLFFASIGLGYIFIEMGQLQRLIIFLGHPVYSITVVIFALLFSSGIGAMVSGLWTGRGRRPGPAVIAVFMALLLIVLIFIIYKQTGILKNFEQAGIYTRIGVSLLFLMPLGFLMGMPFPFGMSIASRHFSELTPWLWAANGAMSVVASVLSVSMSIGFGFTATLQAGLLSYILAAATLIIFSMTRSSTRWAS
ncbi:MAG: hypothetical protein BMS9Abin23_0827 [Thermodesulfobacteriota bacterium]|nr:MAG: hypothetical protein BMS9Abin23_0827 [Thermodesulfobacteriota bacterium]